MDAEKDRRSRMAFSTVNADAKKGGAGGAFTWGSPTSVMDMNYMPTPVMQPNVMTAAQPMVMQAPAPAQPFVGSLSSVQQFPSLGAQPAGGVAYGQMPHGWNTVPQGVMQAPAPPQPIMMQAAAQPMTMQVPEAAMPRAMNQALTASNTQPLQVTQGPVYAAPLRTVGGGGSVAYIAEKDRRSRMSNSTMHGEPKKGGAGGAFTWGAATDTTNYGYVSQACMQPSVMVAPSPYTQPAQLPAQPFVGNLSSAQQFPTLGA
eukprot:TRINITY_DN56632_c0_g1_i1.p3 TRINITY_DN56632_c0_g1~~TRINITY_DN56632_c0_g1_i1.p3  ORF type:complete len:259 (-),score=32.71 TRINITY_DN56632_c0_g1_i1:50-826(-)